MNRIQARSPYFIKYTDTDLYSIEVNLYLYTGTQTSDRGSVTYNLLVEAYEDVCVVDVSQMVADYIDIEFDGLYGSQMIWVDYDLTPTTIVAGEQVEGATQSMVQLEGYDGFRYHQEGAQNNDRANDTNKLLQSNRCVYKANDKVVRIPVIRDSSYTVTYVSNNEVVYQDSVTASLDSDNRIKYITNGTVDGEDSYKERIKADGGSYEESSCLEGMFDIIELYDVDTIYIDGEAVRIKDSICNPFESYKVTFVNRFGALQDLWFTGKSERTMKSKTQGKYRANTLVGDSYSISAHNSRGISRNAVDSMKINSGFIVEDCLVAFKELELSNQAWIEIDGDTLPIIVKDGTYKYKTHLNDGLINYSTTVEFAFNTISNIR